MGIVTPQHQTWWRLASAVWFGLGLRGVSRSPDRVRPNIDVGTVAGSRRLSRG